MPIASQYAVHEKKKRWNASVLKKWRRVISNLFAIFLILMAGVIVSLLLWKGMFFSRFAIPYYQTSSDWVPYNQTCRLTYEGFIANTCSLGEIDTTGQAAWTAIGVQFAADIQLATNSTSYVTTCLVGTRRNWVGVVLIAAENGFPECLPSGEQEILGMTVLEAATTQEHSNGVFLTSTFSGQSKVQTEFIEQSDGTSTRIFDALKKSLISTDGVRTHADTRQVNYCTTLNSLNARYLMRLSSVVVYLDISHSYHAEKGWSIGKSNRFVGTFGWDTEHRVSNHFELLIFQVIIVIATLGLLANDGIITLEGLSGLLKGRPVLTYDLFSALERRKLLLVFLVWTMMFSPLYADVLRYLHRLAGDIPWLLSLMMMGNLFAWSWLAILTCIQYIPCPSPWRYRPLAYSAPVLVYCNIIIFVMLQVIKNRGFVEFVAFWADANPLLGLKINGQMMNAGAYSLDGTTPVIYKLMPDIIICLIVSWLISIIAFATTSDSRRCFIDTSWAGQNTFMTIVGVPHWITCMDLDRHNAIAIGDKLFCKPSTLVLLGYTTVHAGQAVDENLNRSNRHYVIGIYDLISALVPVLLTHRPPKLLGTIESNSFLPNRSTSQLDPAMKYIYSRGDCCG